MGRRVPYRYNIFWSSSTACEVNLRLTRGEDLVACLVPQTSRRVFVCPGHVAKTAHFTLGVRIWLPLNTTYTSTSSWEFSLTPQYSECHSWMMRDWDAADQPRHALFLARHSGQPREPNSRFSSVCTINVKSHIA